MALRPGVAKPQYDTVRYRAEFRGSFHQMARFISQIENWKQFKRFVNISAYSVEATSKGTAFDDNKQRHVIKMTLELYRYQEPAAAPATPGPAAPAKPAPTG
jgi:Tfp pilus assembly protein PilO